MIWLEDDNQKLVITSYPLVLVTIVIIVALMGAVATVISGQDVALKDGAIFYGVIAVFLLIHRRKVSVFDPQHKTISFTQKNLFINRTETLNFADVSRLELAHGRGSGVAKGGALVIVCGDKRHNITDSDLARGTQKNLSEALALANGALQAQTK